MALEDRVKALEDETAVLRDQIRQTLLEIQEQILMHYYPDLRSRESSPANAAPYNPRGNGASKSAPPFPGVQRFVLGQPEETHVVSAPPHNDATHPNESTPGPAVDTSSSAAPAPSIESVVAAPTRSDNCESSDLATIARVTAWATDTVQKIGKQRTAKAIEIYAQGGCIDPAIKATLLDLIALSDDEVPVQRVSLKVILDTLLKLNEALGRKTDLEATRALLKEVTIG